MTQGIVNVEDFEGLINVRVVPLAMKLQRLVQRQALRPSGLPVQEWRLLLSLARYGSSHATQIAEYAALDLAHASRAASRLEQQGLVTRQPDVADNRKRLLKLTLKGKRLVSKVWPKAKLVADDIRSLYTEEEYELLKTLLDRAIDRVDKRLAHTELPPQRADTASAVNK